MVYDSIVFSQSQQSKQNLNPRELAFIGDAVFEILVRERVVRSGISSALLAPTAAKMSCAKAQADFYDWFMTTENLAEPKMDNLIILTPKENDTLKRGRNIRLTHKPNAVTFEQYSKATALETFFGFISLERACEVFNAYCQHIDWL